LWTASGAAEDRGFGASIARCADLDEDGFDDLLVGAPGEDEEEPSGRIVALSAKSGNVLRVVDLKSRGLGLGSSLLSAGDLDGDGCADVLAVALEPLPFHAVTAHVLLVSGQELQVREIAQFEHLRPARYFCRIPLALGRSQDGLPRIAVGLPGHSGRQFGETVGAVEIVDLSGARVARFEPGELEKERVGPDGHRFTGACVASIETFPAAESESTWLVGATGAFCWGSVAIVEGKDWKGRQLLVENEFFRRTGLRKE
jgi:hypothetical protein